MLGLYFLYLADVVFISCYSLPPQHCRYLLLFVATPALSLSLAIRCHPSIVVISCYSLPPQHCRYLLLFVATPALSLYLAIRCHPSIVVISCYSLPPQHCRFRHRSYVMIVRYRADILTTGIEAAVSANSRHCYCS